MGKLYLKYLFEVNKHGKFIFFNYDHFEKKIAEHPGLKGEIIFRDRTEEVSDKQVWYYNKLCEVVADDSGMSEAEIDRYFRHKFIKPDIKNIGDKVREIPRTIDDMDMKEFSKFITQVKEHMTGEFGIPEEKILKHGK